MVPGEGELRISSSIVTANGSLPAVIERFSQDFPRAVLHVLHEKIAIQQYDNLRDRKVELMFGRIPSVATASLLSPSSYDAGDIAATGLRSASSIALARAIEKSRAFWSNAPGIARII